MLVSRHYEEGAACSHEHGQHARFTAVAARTVAEQLLRFVGLTGRNLTEGYIWWRVKIYRFITFIRAYIHERIRARIRLLCLSAVIVLASLCLQHLQLLPTLLCDGRDVLGCCQLAV